MFKTKDKNNSENKFVNYFWQHKFVKLSNKIRVFY